MRLITWSFERDDGAQRAAYRLGAKASAALKIHDGAVVAWPVGQVRPDAWQVLDLGDRDRLSGAFWGTLFATLFLLPLTRSPQPAHVDTSLADEDHAHLGAAIPASDLGLVHLGIDGPFLSATRAAVIPGTSALLMLQDGAGGDAAAAPVQAAGGVLASQVILDPTQQRALDTGFGDQT